MNKSTNNPEPNQTASAAKKEFKIIIMIILFIMFIFMCMFVYNLIKCYLPKWRKNKNEFVDMSEDRDEENGNKIINGNRKLEMSDK